MEAPPAAPHPVAHLQKASSQSLKQVITLTAKEEDAVVVHAVISRTESNAKANGGIVEPAPAKEAVEKTAPPVVVITSLSKSYSTAGAPTHHRCATVDIGGDNSSAAADCGGGTQAQQVISSVPQGFSGEHVIAGWPSWLTSVAGEIVEGWLPRRADTFERLDKIGQGTYSNVYKARDLQSGKIVALKRVRFVNMDPESVRFMAREIHILRRLDHPNVIKLEGIVTSRLSHSLYLVFEYMPTWCTTSPASPRCRGSASRSRRSSASCARSSRACATATRAESCTGTSRAPTSSSPHRRQRRAPDRRLRARQSPPSSTPARRNP